MIIEMTLFSSVELGLSILIPSLILFGVSDMNKQSELLYVKSIIKDSSMS